MEKSGEYDGVFKAYQAVKERPNISKYLESDRRQAYGDGIYRYYPELQEDEEWRKCASTKHASKNYDRYLKGRIDIMSPGSREIILEGIGTQIKYPDCWSKVA